MAKTFRPWVVDQAWLLPPSVTDFVTPGHLATFIRDTVREELDLSTILADYVEERGFPPYHPVMMTALLLYAYCQGIYSSRRIARSCEERVDFMAVTGMQRPDFRTVSDFRRRHLAALGALFGQVLKLCDRAGMVKLGHVALDGTKVQANASKHKAMSYERMKRRERELAEEVAKWFAAADSADAAEDSEFGRDRRGDELPDWVRNKEERRSKIREAMAALEAEAEAASGDPDDEPPEGGGSDKRKQRNVPKNGAPHPKAQRNFTDPDSKIMKTSNGFVQGYNCQAAVDAAHQVIVAHEVTNQNNDAPRLVSMLDGIRRHVGRQAKELSADSGYASEANLAELSRRRVRGYVALKRQAHSSEDRPRRRAIRGKRQLEMQERIARGGYRSRYRLRKQTVEPVFGQIKEARAFRRFFLRGLAKVPHEWALICTAHNLRKFSRFLEGRPAGRKVRRGGG